MLFFFVCFVFIYMPEKLDDTSFGIIYIYIIFIYKAIEVSAVKKKRRRRKMRRLLVLPYWLNSN